MARRLMEILNVALALTIAASQTYVPSTVSYKPAPSDGDRSDDHKGDDEDHNEMNDHKDFVSFEKFYMGKIFGKYGQDRRLTIEGFEHLLENLNLGWIRIEDHDLHDHRILPGEDFKRLHHDGHRHGITNDIVANEHDKNVEDDVVHRDGDHDEENHNNNKEFREKSRKRKKNGKRKKKKGKSREKRKEEESHAQHHETFHAVQDSRVDKMIHSPKAKVENQDCLTTQNYWKNMTENFRMGVSRDMFLHICPSLIYQIESDACAMEKRQDRFGHFVRLGEIPIIVSEDSIPLRTWGFAVGSILIISMCGIIGVAIVPLTQKTYYKPMLQFFIALAVGSLTGDALFHLLPHSMSSPGGHPRDADERLHGADQQRGAEHLNHVVGVGKGMMAALGLFGFFLIERMTMIWRERKRVKRSPEIDCELREKILIKNNNSDVDGNCETTTKTTTTTKSVKRHNHGHSHDKGDGTSSTALMVILGDGVHNFADGMAVGAAFAASVAAGLATALAVLFHELPHEIGDFAVLVNAGMGIRKAFFYNIVSSILAMIGLICGLLIAGKFHDTSTWIFAMTAGSFLYISLADLLPELTLNLGDGDFETTTTTTTATTDRNIGPCQLFLLQMTGISLGLGIMAFIGIYEENLKKIFD